MVTASIKKSDRNMLNRMLLTVLVFLCSCTSEYMGEIPVFVSPQADKVEQNAAEVLTKYLAELYPDYDFPVTRSFPDTGTFILMGSAESLDERSNILHSLIPADEQTRVPGSFSVSHKKQKGQNIGIIYGSDSKGVLNGVYALLEGLGYGFYLSLEHTPPDQPEFDFAKWDFSDSPHTEERIVFNWHNFLSGCSTWDLPEWKKWIDHSAKMRFNMIMVHAYGNNPMFTYSFNGKQKKTSRLPATQGGRDYGTQQVNDVRRLHGGDVFDRPVFGAEVSRVKKKNHVEAAQKLMGQVFDYAEEQGMKISFAFDIDTSPANPQELINTLPSSARFCIPLERNKYAGRYHDTFCMANPDTPEGYLFYKAQIVSLLDMYPQIDQIALWMRRQGSEWLSLNVDQLPSGWQTEYRKIVKQYPEYSAWNEAPGRFALGKITTAFQRALQEIGRQDIVLKAGSWAFDWMEPSNVFFPQDIGFIGLDYNVLEGTSDVDLPEQQKRIARISKNRPVTPVFWAHHDDGAYIGRPYVPINSLQKKLDKIGAEGFGIIHWTTWPLDPYFKNMGLQVWERSLNQDYKLTIDEMAADLFGQKQRKKTSSYLYKWSTTAPMMGRETREWFINHGFTDQEVQTVAREAEDRIHLLEEVNEDALTETYQKYLRYFKGLEEFSMGFYRTENAYQRSLKFMEEGRIDKAIDAIQEAEPEQLAAQYGRISTAKGITKGEKGIIISLNLDWLPFVENQRQALGQAPIRYNFAPTVHPGFGQGLLRTNFFMDIEQNLWRNYGREETGANAYKLSHKLQLNAPDSLPKAYKEIFFSGIKSDSTIRIKIEPIMADIRPFGPTRDRIATEIRPGKYQLQLLFASAPADKPEESIQDLFISSHSDHPAVITERIDMAQQSGEKDNMILKSYDIFVPDQGEVIVELEPIKGEANICGIIMQRKDSVQKN